MKFREIKHRITAFMVLSAFTFTSVPVYAEVADEVVVEEAIENGAGNVEESSNDAQVLEVTVTLLSEEAPEEASEDISEEAPEATESPEVMEAEVPEQENQDISNTEASEPIVIEENNIEVADQSELVETNTVVPEQSEITESNSEVSEPNDVEEANDTITNTEANTDSASEGDVITDSVETANTPAVEAANGSADKSSDNNSIEGQLMTPEMEDIRNGDGIQYSKTIESVSTSQSSTGRYNVSFTISEKNENTGVVKKYQYTITGFASEADIEAFLSSVGQTSLKSGDTGSVFSNPNLIDAEKKMWEYSEEIKINPDADPKDDYDSNHCWAGSAADMLVLSGWYKADSIADGYNFQDEDDVFDYFNHNYTDDAGNAGYGIQWFFSGINFKQSEKGWSHLKNEEGYSNALLKDYCAQDFSYNELLSSEDQLIDLLKMLDQDSDGDRCALGLIIGYYKYDEDGNKVLDEDGNHYRAGGHCITIAGYSTDENGLPATVVLIDSDSYNSDNAPVTSSKDNDERAYKNTYSTYPIKFYDGQWHLMNYYNGPKYDVLLDEIDVLKYYSNNTKNKVEQGGTKDLINNVDIWTKFLCTMNTYDDDNVCYSFYEGEGIDLFTYLINFSNVFTDLGTTVLPYRIEITQDGQIIRSSDYSLEMAGSDFKSKAIIQRLLDENSSLAPGEYTVTFIVNPDRTITEAYYNNNSKGAKFVILKRVDSDGNEHYEVVSVEDSSDNNNETSITNSVNDLFDYSFEEDQSVYISDPSKHFNFMFKGGLGNMALTDADLADAEVLFNYSIASGLSGSGINFGSNLSITKDDYSIVRNADGTISVVFSNAFMRKLPKGTHYFKMIIAGKTYTFKIVIK